jgi:hypothetical protein
LDFENSFSKTFKDFEMFCQSISLFYQPLQSEATLVCTPTLNVFQLQLEKFLHHWVGTYALFANYFSAIWVTKYPSAVWASFAQPSHVPAGDQILKAWHNQLQNFILPNDKERIDHVAGTLSAEWRYFEILITEPVLAAETYFLIFFFFFSKKRNIILRC